ncbi:hypothetical protein [Anaerosporobacter sp.]
MKTFLSDIKHKTWAIIYGTVSMDSPFNKAHKYSMLIVYERSSIVATQIIEQIAISQII